MLEQVHEALWIAEGVNVDFHGIPYPTRAVVVRMESGGLWIWSPVKLRPGLRAEIDRLGAVRHLVSPNKLHHLYLQEWKTAYPGAALWGPQSTIKKRRDLRFRGALEDDPPPDWGAAFDQAWFRGSFAMDEIVFFHRASATVIVADLIQTFSGDFLRKYWGVWRFLARIGGVTQDKAGAPIDWRLTFINRAPARRARGKVLRWPSRRVIMAHGAWVRGDWARAESAAFLARSFRWLGP